MVITLLTDFGTRDIYVGVMKGVIKGIAPGAEIIDLTHEIPPQDIMAGAFALKGLAQYFPAGTVHLAVVDPGVGSARRPIAARIGDALFVCPDNGLLSYLLPNDSAVECVMLTHTQYHRPSVSRTFHGRDIFAPVAAHLAMGVPLDKVGAPADSLTTFPISAPRVAADEISCHVITTDVFGNAITDLTEDAYYLWDGTRCQITVGPQHIPGPASSYSDVPSGTPLALFGSSGHLEVAIRNGNAALQLGLQRGDPVRLQRT